MDNEPALPTSSNVPRRLESERNFYCDSTPVIKFVGPRQNENPGFLFQILLKIIKNFKAAMANARPH